MIIAIRSEVDSRVLLYPLIRALRSYGSICVISSNRQLQRLIEDEAEGGFRNIRIIVEESGATDDVYKEYGVAIDDYDFIFLDNVGIIDYDICLIPLGARHSEAFDEDVVSMLESEGDKTFVIQFGKKIPNKEKDKNKKSKKDALLEEYDPADKFKNSENDAKNEKQNRRVVSIPYPSYQEIESVESEYKFYEVNTTLVNKIYDIFRDVLAVDRNRFQKEVRKKDESSGYIKSRNSTREE